MVVKITVLARFPHALSYFLEEAPTYSAAGTGAIARQGAIWGTQEPPCPQEPGRLGPVRKATRWVGRWAVTQTGKDQVVAESLIRALAQGAQFFCRDLCSVTRKTGVRCGFFHDDAWFALANSRGFFRDVRLWCGDAR